MGILIYPGTLSIWIIQVQKGGQPVQVELKKYQHDRSIKLAEQKKLHNTIIQERLCEEKIKQSKPEKKKVVAKNKIVHI